MSFEHVEIRRATPEDIVAFYGKPQPWAMYAWLALYKGQMACIAGLRMDYDPPIAFSEVKEGIDAPKLTVYRAAKQLLENIKGLGLPMIAAASKCHKDSAKFLEKLGFQYFGNEEDMEIYKWRWQRQ